MSDDDDEKAPVAQHRLGCIKNSTMPSAAAFMFSPSSHLSSLMAKGFSPSPAAHSALSLGQCFGPPTIAMDGHVMERNQGGGGDSEACRNKDEEQESKSGSDNNFDGGTGSGEEQDGSCRPRKKRYHRHTPHQIQEMEMFFKECPHPDDKQRKELSRELGLEPLQVKFWFQNKRTQMKTQHERMENSQLKAENEKLMAENMRYKEALAHATCPTCGGPAALGELSYDEHQLRVENARLREEIDRLSSIAAKCVGKPLNSLPSMPMSRSGLDLGMGFSDVYGVGCNRENSVNTRTLALSYGPTESEKPMVIELAVEAMEELMRLAQMTDPIWTSTSLADETTLQVLNEEEYKISFSSGVGPKPPNFKSEGSKESAVVMISAMSLVEMLLDVNQWTSMFPDIISRGVMVDVLSMGVAGSYNGALQVMYAEFQVPTPLVATRESYFARYCKQHSEGVWAVVDVSLDDIRGNLAPPTMRCRRRPSGLVVQQMPNCYTKVTWVEHVEADERGVHQMYANVVNSGMAFGAKRWVASLYRQCERLASVMATNIPSSEAAVIPNQEGRKGMLKLAERMVISFCGGVSQSTAHTWITLSGGGAENVRVMTRKSVDDPGRPPGIVLNAATSFWMPLSPSSLFLFLKDHSNRSQWDILSNGAVVQEVAHIANGHDPSNYVSLLRVSSVNPNQSNMLILQESCRDACASYVVYAPVDVPAMNSVLNGSDPDYTALLPSGFAILSDGHGSSLLTVAFQILVNPEPNAKLSLGSVATVNSLISCTIDRIKATLSPPQPSQSQ